MALHSVPIHTPSLILREFVIEDVPKVFQMSLEPGMRKWLPDQVYRDEEHTKQVLEHLMKQYSHMESPAQAPCVLGICLKTTGELIGHVGLSPCRKQVEIGFALEDKHQGKGYATEAVAAMAAWGSAAFALPSILGIAASENLGSCRVLEKAGFVLASEDAGILNGWEGIIRTYVKNFPYQNVQSPHGTGPWGRNR